MTQSTEIMVRFREIAETLSGEDQQSLLAFAEFLSSRSAQRRVCVPAPIPGPAPGPAGETVVAAMKRLSAQYPMLDKAKLLDGASQLMAEHVLRGRGATDVVARLEELFTGQYQKFLQGERRDS